MKNLNLLNTKKKTQHINVTEKKFKLFPSLLLSICMVICLQMSFSALGQTSGNTIKGAVTDNLKNAMRDVLVQLLQSNDSSMVKTDITDEKGEYHFRNILKGNYIIHINLMGFNKYYSFVISIDSNKEIAIIILTKSEETLKEVTINANKPFIERNHGILTLNVENSISAAGSSVFEIIEKAPGVSIDYNDNISMKGKKGIIVQIDGKPTPMTGADLGNYLRGIPSASIEKIEFITNPSSKYDAAGTAIINIKLKKDKKLGTNGNISLAYGQGRYPKSNNGISFNHRNKKINIFGNYSYAYREAFNSLNLNRKFYKTDSFIGAYEQSNYLLFAFKNQIARMGFDYYANAKNTFGFVFNGVSNKFNPKGDNVSNVYDNTATRTSYFETSNRSIDNWYNFSTNLNHKHIFDSAGKEITTDIDYAHFGNRTQQNFTTNYFDLNNNMYQSPYLLYGNIKGGLDIFAIKSDFVKPTKKKYKIETGVKSSYVKADNNLAFYNKSSGVAIYDSTKSNHFIYKENINAAYINITKDWKKWNTQFGLRAEHTHVVGTQIIYNTSFTNNYIQLFPNTFIGYNFNQKHSIEFNYNRRITRPSYDQLNPFKFFLDPTTYKEGNPYLKPQTTHSIEISYVYKQRIYTTLGFGRTLHNITEVIAPADNQIKLTVQTNKNLATVDVYSLSFTIPAEITKWWKTSNDISIYYAEYSGNIANTTISQVGNLTYNINTVNSFSITPTVTAELSGNYRANEVYAFDRIKPIWSLNAGVQKKLFKNRAILKFNISDICYTNKTRATTQFTDYKESFTVARDTRVAVISFNYKFGKYSVPISRRRNGGAEDIKQRAGGTVG